MDGKRFDEWTKILGASRSRRATLKTIAATMLAGAGLVYREASAAQCLNPRHPCRSDSQCCNEQCDEGSCRCTQLQQPCKKASHCCQRSALCGQVEKSECAADPGVCCQPPGFACSSACDCCGAVACTDGQCCAPAGEKCAEDNDCCGSGTCVRGHCCTPPQGECDKDDDCCGKAVCGGILGQVCCLLPGDTCDAEFDCCDTTVTHGCECDALGNCTCGIGI